MLLLASIIICMWVKKKFHKKNRFFLFVFTLNCADLVWLLFCDFFFPETGVDRVVYLVQFECFFKINYTGDIQSSNIFCIRQTVNSSYVLVQMVVLNQFTRPFFFFFWVIQNMQVFGSEPISVISFSKRNFLVCSEALLWGTLSLIPVGYIICWIDELMCCIVGCMN